mmetsp:Transcript_31492/g.86663  ORF Transcript_31492/g.86663 Transcript_31492/m.86663 type:complete len:256 (+) Transcript_31492:205-972(+)
MDHRGPSSPLASGAVGHPLMENLREALPQLVKQSLELAPAYKELRTLHHDLLPPAMVLEYITQHPQRVGEEPFAVGQKGGPLLDDFEQACFASERALKRHAAFCEKRPRHRPERRLLRDEFSDDLDAAAGAHRRTEHLQLALVHPSLDFVLAGGLAKGRPLDNARVVHEDTVRLAVPELRTEAGKQKSEGVRRGQDARLNIQELFELIGPWLPELDPKNQACDVWTGATNNDFFLPIEILRAVESRRRGLPDRIS